MKRTARIGLGVGALMLGVAFGEVSVAQAEHKSRGFSGTFRGPHGQFSIQIGSPRYPVGSYVPYGHRISRRPRYGYGFDTPAAYCRPHRVRHSHWVPVRRYERRWVVVERPIAVVERGYSDGYRGGSDPYYEDARYGDRYSYEDRYRSQGRHVCWAQCPTHHSRHKHSRSCRHDDDDWDDD